MDCTYELYNEINLKEFSPVFQVQVAMDTYMCQLVSSHQHFCLNKYIKLDNNEINNKSTLLSVQACKKKINKKTMYLCKHRMKT